MARGEFETAEQSTRQAGELVANPLPAWATSVLADPVTNRSVNLRQVASFDDLGPQVEYGVAGSIAYLLAITSSELESMRAIYGPMIELIDHQRETLRPFQTRVRKLLARFGRSLPRDSVMADLACNDGEFAPFFSHCRYIAMDLWPEALAVGLDSGRIKFGVVADVRQPPVVPASLDAFVSTGTLHHLPSEDIVPAVLNLLRFVKPGGRVAITAPDEFVKVALQQLPAGYRLIERELFQGPIDRWWGNAVTRKTAALVRRVKSPALQRGIAVMQNKIAAFAYRVDLLLHRLGVGTFDWDWLVVEREASSPPATH